MEFENIILTKWLCDKCGKVGPGSFLTLDLSNIPDEFKELKEIKRDYCWYCSIEFYDKHIGQVSRVEDKSQ